MFLFTLGVLRASTVYFRCREEQSDGGGNDRCDPPSEFHMPIGNLVSRTMHRVTKQFTMCKIVHEYKLDC